MAFVWKHSEAIVRQLIPDPPLIIPFQAWTAGEGKRGLYDRNLVKPVPQGGTARRPQAMTGFEFISNNIYISQTDFNMGSSAAEVRYPVRIWHTFRREVTYSLDKINVKGVTLTPQDGTVLGDPLPYHGIRDYELYASVNTDVDVNAIFRFDWDTGWESDINLIGLRVVLWPYVPTPSITEGLEWTTSVIKTKGSEERYAHRFYPRMRMDYDYTMDSHKLSELRILYGAWRYNTFAIPYWMEMTTAQPLAEGATKVYLDTTKGRFLLNEMICINDGDQYMVSIITAVTPTEVTIDPPVDTIYANPIAIPCGRGRILGDVSATHSNTGLYKVKASFDHPEAVWAEVQPYPVYLNYPVLTTRPLDGGRDMDSFPVNVIDNTVGNVTILQEYDYDIRTRRYVYAISDILEANTWRGFLNYLKGQYRAVWIPDWSASFELTQGQDENSTQLAVRMNLMERYETYKYLMVELQDGTMDYFEILTTSVVGGDTILQLDRPLGFAVTLDNIRNLTRLNLMRLSGDGVELSYNRPHQGRVSLNFTVAPEIQS
ncbi:hypothetical protein NVP2117O_43 [Vibrio phage 2.117.O._10N.261.45.E9]|nr:hypothetical protein NVP1117O_43 [Vibrio phage 1.117.O._10N.261.45.E9]AUR95444.1 hypothetical protein NVP1207B_37 [Vibrio phage 1.207.B._10N.222.51.C2]AUS02335.1 hypothetical protein NVP2117O_43 [Vibrio phage 2.117.O._10N.261.45.E9]